MTRPTTTRAHYRVQFDQHTRQWVLLARVEPTSPWLVLPTAGDFQGAHAAIPYYEALAEKWAGRREYRHCLKCGRPMRRRYWKLVDHPGTVGEESHGVCRGCARQPAADPDLRALKREPNTVDEIAAARRVIRRAVSEPDVDYMLDMTGLREDST